MLSVVVPLKKHERKRGNNREEVHKEMTRKRQGEDISGRERE